MGALSMDDLTGADSSILLQVGQFVPHGVAPMLHKITQSVTKSSVQGSQALPITLGAILQRSKNQSDYLDTNKECPLTVV